MKYATYESYDELTEWQFSVCEAIDGLGERCWIIKRKAPDVEWKIPKSETIYRGKNPFTRISEVRNWTETETYVGKTQYYCGNSHWSDWLGGTVDDGVRRVLKYDNKADALGYVDVLVLRYTPPTLVECDE